MGANSILRVSGNIGENAPAKVGPGFSGVGDREFDHDSAERADFPSAIRALGKMCFVCAAFVVR